MRTRLFLLFALVTLSAKAQNNHHRIYKSADQEMLVLVNYEVVGGMDLLKLIPPEAVSSIGINREERLASKDNLFQDGRATSGLVTAQADFNFQVKTQEELNEFFGLAPETEVYVNGFLLESKRYKIASKSIAEVEVLESDNVFLQERVLNVTVR